MQQQLQDKYDPTDQYDELIRYRFAGPKYSLMFITIPYKNYNIEIQLGELTDEKQQYDSIKILTNGDDVTDFLVSTLPSGKIRPFGENLFHIFNLIDSMETSECYVE